MVKNLLSVIILIVSLVVNDLSAQNYTILGSASTFNGCDCFRITPNSGNQAGAIFQNKTINLNNSFDYTFSVFFGCNNGGGADGLMFVLTSNPNGLGNPGEGLGYAGTNQPFSFAVEFDTYQNGNAGDPGQHHIGFNSAGQYNHNVAGPVSANPSGNPIDDCQSHTVRVVWDVNTNTYSVYLDGNLRLSTVIPNIVNQYFGGNPIVNWGWTAATGGGTNDQRVCIETISSWVAGTNYQSCVNTMQFTDISTSNVGTIQSWAWAFGDGGTSTQQNPSHTYPGIGTYNVSLTITDVSGCTKVYGRPVTIAAPITLAPTLTPPPCNGGTNGSISVVPSGGFGAAAGYGGFSYTWSTGFNGSTAVGIGAGTYTVTATDGVCTTTGQYTLTQPTPLTASVSKTDANCGQNNGTATIVLSGGTLPYTQVDWGGGFVGTTVTGLAPGTKIADFRDANGCSSLLQYSAVIGSLPCGVTSSVSKTDVTCFGGNNGTATLTVSGATGTITWNPGGQTGATASNLTAGTYTYSFSNGNPAQAFSGTVVITQPSAAMVVSLNALNTSCAGTADGQAIVSVPTGGVAPYNYAWSGGQPNNAVANNLSAGAIAVTVTDSRGCTGSASGSITAPPALTINITTIDDSCFQGGKGQASANVTGGTSPYTYYWNNISPAQNNLDLVAGTYLVTVTDNNNCTATGSATINEPPAFTYTITSQNINCFGGTTGSIAVAANGGTPAYAYTWNPATASGANPTSLAAGKYIVTISDNKNCQNIDSVTLTQPAAALSATTSHTDVTCNGLNNGTITVNTSGGTPPYTFLGNPLPAGTITIPSLAPNTYAGDITDANGCTFAVSETVAEPAVLSLTETHVDVLCNGNSTGSIDITVTGGNTPYSYTWNNGATTEDLNNLVAATYIPTCTDAKGCTASISITIAEPTALVVTETHTDILCNGQSTGAIDVSVSGGTSPYTYLWNDGNTNEDRTAIPAGTYLLTVTDNNGCTQTLSVTVAEPALLTATSSHTNVTCNGLNNGTITLNVNGGTPPYSFLGNAVPSGTTTVPSLAPNTYAGNLTDANGCSVALTETITEPAVLALSETHVDAICNGSPTGSIDITVTGGTTPYSYLWNGGATSQDRSGIVAGNYIVTVTDNNQCTQTIAVTVTEPAAVPLSVTATDATCFGGNGSATANPTGGTPPYTYTWSGGGSTQTVTPPAGNYSVSATDVNQCNQVATFTINEPPQIIVQENHTDVNCFGGNNGQITLTVSGGTGAPNYTYAWSPNVSTSNAASTLTAAAYSITVTDANTCTVVQNVTVAEPTPLTVTAVATPTLCFTGSTGSITATASGSVPSYTYVASDGTNTFNSASGSFAALAQGNYSIIATDQNACTATASAQVSGPTAVSAFVTTTDVTCFGKSDGTATVAASGGTPAYTFTFSNGASNTSGLVTNLVEGNYTITITDANGCSITDVASIVQPDSVIISVSPSPATVNLGESLQMNSTTNQSGTITYQWTPSTGLSCNDCDNPIYTGINSLTYTVSAITQNGCVGTTTVELTVVPNYDVYIPNAFSPNNDGGNDFWSVYGNLKALKEFEIQVFNRWGEKVYESADPNFKWDGYTNGKLIDGGVYVYTAKFVFIDNHTNTNFKGSLTVLR